MFDTSSYVRMGVNTTSLVLAMDSSRQSEEQISSNQL
jgi:hypothetical protein